MWQLALLYSTLYSLSLSCSPDSPVRHSGVSPTLGKTRTLSGSRPHRVSILTIRESCQAGRRISVLQLIIPCSNAREISLRNHLVNLWFGQQEGSSLLLNFAVVGLKLIHSIMLLCYFIAYNFLRFKISNYYSRSLIRLQQNQDAWKNKKYYYEVCVKKQ